MSGTVNCDVVCWDTETSDTDVRHGQIFDFAAVTSNLTDLVETGSRSVRIRRLSYCIPAYGALSTNSLDPYDLDDPERLDEFTAAAAIHEALSPVRGRPLVVLGYNILSFDEEMARSLFFRNLLDPYPTSAKGVRRFDLLPAARLAHALDPVSFPAGGDDEGGVSFRLERIAPANGIRLRAHDALEDTRATLALARRIREAVPAAWDTALRASDRYEAERVFDQASRRGEPVWIMTGGNSPILEAVLPVSKEGRMLLSLRADRVEEVLRDGHEAVAAAEWKGGPLVRCRTNRMPILLSRSDALALQKLHPQAFAVSVEAVDGPGPGWADFKARLADLSARADPWADPPDPTAEERIYSGFTSWAEKETMQRFRLAGSWFERAGMVRLFGDRRVREFAARAVVEHGGLTPLELVEAAGQSMADEIADLADVAFERPFASEGARWMTIARARIEGRHDDRFRTWLEDLATPVAPIPPPVFEVEADRRGQLGWSF